MDFQSIIVKKYHGLSCVGWVYNISPNDNRTNNITWLCPAKIVWPFTRKQKLHKGPLNSFWIHLVLLFPLLTYVLRWRSSWIPNGTRQQNFTWVTCLLSLVVNILVVSEEKRIYMLPHAHVFHYVFK